jgi:Cu(I)/Ag(I) efflux system membrane fusion protein
MFRLHHLYLVLLLGMTYSHAEMKCSSGKCSSGSADTGKNIPRKTLFASSISSGKTPEATKEEKTQRKERSKNEQPRATVKQLFNVRTVKVTLRQNVQHMVNYGYIAADESLQSVITPFYSGYVKTLFVKERFTRVKKGDRLAAIYSPEVYRAKQEYLNALKYNDRQPSAAMLKSARQKLLLLGVEPGEIDRLRTKRRIDPLTILYADRDGWIMEQNTLEGAYVSAKMPLFKILDLHHVWMEAKLYQEQLEKLGNMEHFEVTVKGSQKKFEAKKMLLHPLLDPKESTATLRLRIKNPRKFLKVGMYATLHSYGRSEKHLSLPRTAVIRKGGKWYVFLATAFKGEYEPVEVKIKPIDDDYVAILEGLREGERVVNNALFMMDSDAQINSIY